MHHCMLTAGLQMASQEPTFSSSQMVLHLSCMHLMRRLFPSEICTLKCPRQQSLQKKCPHSMAETSAGSQQQKQHWQSTGPDGSDALLPAHGKWRVKRQPSCCQLALKGRRLPLEGSDGLQQGNT